MKINYAFCLLIISVIGMNATAQSKKSTETKSLIEKGSAGDLFIGNKIKKDQLKAAPVRLELPGPAHKKRSAADRQSKNNI